MRALSMLIALFCSSLLAAQIGTTVVSAPALETIAAKDAANTAQTLTETAKQTTELANTANMINQTLDWVQKVNTVISTGNHTYNIINNVSEVGILIDEIFEAIGKAEADGESKKVIRLLLESTSKLLTENETVSIDLNDLVVDNRLIMDDAARLQFLKDLEEKTRRLKAECYNTLLFIRRL